jgi:GDPmannose 4,6-dehydratase
MKRALITGITGQDGSYLSEFLLGKGYEVHGLIRRASSFNSGSLDAVCSDPHTDTTPLHLHYGDLADGTVLRRVLERVQPDEVYNLGAPSHVKESFEEPEYTADIVAVGALRLLDSVADYTSRTDKEIRLYQAGSAEMFGATPPPQRETTPFYPRSPYAASKVAAHWFTVNYREAYGLFACNGILFNHESPRRGEAFVTRKITRAIGRIKAGLQQKLYLGNLEARRDWGFAGDYVEAMWLMLQQEHPDDYVIATGESHSVNEFVELAFGMAGLDPQDYVEVDPRHFRASEVNFLQGDASNARARLGWEPRVTFPDLVRMMVEHDMELALKELTLRNASHIVDPRDAATL